MSSLCHCHCPPNRRFMNANRVMPVERIGDILRREDAKSAATICSISPITFASAAAYLEAIENSEYDEFPADAYVIGFLRSYAEFLGLDGKEAINLYRAEMAGRRKKPTLTMPTPMPEGRSPSAFILIGAVVTAILVYAAWYGLSTSDRATISAPQSLSSSATSSSSDTANNASPSATVVPIVPVAMPAPPAEQVDQQPSVAVECSVAAAETRGSGTGSSRARQTVPSGHTGGSVELDHGCRQ